MRIALFPGSFDPFTEGHRSVVERIRPLFDRVIVAIGHNPQKLRWQPVSESAAAIEALFKGDEGVVVTHYDCLTADLAVQLGADCIVKGVRSVKDYEYELQQADANRHLSGIETLLIPALPELAYLSSTFVRETAKFRKSGSN